MDHVSDGIEAGVTEAAKQGWEYSEKGSDSTWK